MREYQARVRARSPLTSRPLSRAVVAAGRARAPRRARRDARHREGPRLLRPRAADDRRDATRAAARPSSATRRTARRASLARAGADDEEDFDDGYGAAWDMPEHLLTSGIPALFQRTWTQVESISKDLAEKKDRIDGLLARMRKLQERFDELEGLKHVERREKRVARRRARPPPQARRHAATSRLARRPRHRRHRRRRARRRQGERARTRARRHAAYPALSDKFALPARRARRVPRRRGATGDARPVAPPRAARGGGGRRRRATSSCACATRSTSTSSSARTTTTTTTTASAARAAATTTTTLSKSRSTGCTLRAVRRSGPSRRTLSGLNKRSPPPRFSLKPPARPLALWKGRVRSRQSARVYAAGSAMLAQLMESKMARIQQGVETAEDGVRGTLRYLQGDPSETLLLEQLEARERRSTRARVRALPVQRPTWTRPSDFAMYCLNDDDAATASGLIETMSEDELRQARRRPRAARRRRRAHLAARRRDRRDARRPRPLEIDAAVRRCRCPATRTTSLSMRRVPMRGGGTPGPVTPFVRQIETSSTISAQSR